MKLLYCSKCKSVFNLTQEWKQCECGETTGRYTDNKNAEYVGNDAVPFAIDNFSFFARMQPELASNEIYDGMHGKNKIHCWLMTEETPNFDTIKKLDKRPKPKRILRACR